MRLGCRMRSSSLLALTALRPSRAGTFSRRPLRRWLQASRSRHSGRRPIPQRCWTTPRRPPARRMRIHNHDIVATATTYADGRPNEPFVYIGSMGYLEVAVRDARADKLLGARPGMKVELM